MQSEPRGFLQNLSAGKPDELYLLLWTLPEKRSHWFRNVLDAIEFAESRHKHDLYIGVGLSRRDYGTTRRCPSNEVAGIVGLWADIDVNSGAHAKGALPRTLEDALEILPKQLPPTFLIRTGNGIHAWWLLREALIFETDEERANAASFAKRWQSLFRLTAAGRGWAFDCLSDLARLLRVPGTQNCKDPQKPKLVEIHSQSDRRYNPSELAEFLDDHGIPDPDEPERLNETWQDKFADSTLTINQSAIVPEDLLQRHMSEDSRFKDTWLRKRDDLIDQSQSGYDLALVNFGFKAGLSEQHVVNLIIHHRRIHGQSPRTRLDYFQRTIAKACKRNDGVASENLFAARREERPGQERPHSKPDSATDRALLCEQISAVLGVRILRIVKITGKQPTYHMELESGKIEFPTVNKLVDQKNFRMTIASAADRFISRTKSSQWEQITQMMLDALTIADGGVETDLVGGAQMYVDQYLGETPFIDSVERPPTHLRCKPTIIDGQVAICSDDLQLYINKTRGENHPIKDVASMLTAIGASSTRIKVTRLRDQTRWLLPLSEFDPSDYTAGCEEKPNA